MTSNTLPTLLTLDYKLIDEALRRLNMGTCCLLDDEKEAVFDLFHKLRAALLDHIQFEEETLFPSIQKAPEKSNVGDFISLMRAEHTRLKGLLSEARHELEESHGDGFRETLQKFILTLNEHRKLEESIPYAQIVGDLGDDNVKRMIARSHDGFLK